MVHVQQILLPTVRIYFGDCFRELSKYTSGGTEINTKRHFRPRFKRKTLRETFITPRKLVKIIKNIFDLFSIWFLDSVFSCMNKYWPMYLQQYMTSYTRALYKCATVIANSSLWSKSRYKFTEDLHCHWFLESHDCHCRGTCGAVREAINIVTVLYHCSNIFQCKWITFYLS
jgi:hypothetical protein